MGARVHLHVRGVLQDERPGKPYPSDRDKMLAATRCLRRLLAPPYPTLVNPAFGPEYLKKNIQLEACLRNSDHLIKEALIETHTKHFGVDPETSGSPRIPLQGSAPLAFFSEDVCP